jgi:guanylate kinase
MTKPLDVLRALEPNYQPSPQTAEAIQDKELVAFIGAFAVGKTTLMRTIAAEHEGYTEVVSFTSRPPREGDDNYRFMEHTEANIERLVGKARMGRLVNFAVHATTGFVYGTEPEDYRSRHCMLATTAKSYESDKNLPFAVVRPVVVVAQPEAWLDRISARSTSGQDRMARMREARLSLEWSLDQQCVLYVNNTDSDISSTANRVVRALDGSDYTLRSERRTAEAMLIACNE